MRAAVALTGGVQLHDFRDHASTSVSYSGELLFGESVPDHNESISIKDSLCVFDSVRVQNFEALDAVVLA